MTADSLVGRLRQKATELRALDSVATPAPWSLDGRQIVLRRRNGVFDVARTPPLADEGTGGIRSMADARLIAAARGLPLAVATVIDTVLDLHPVDGTDMCAHCYLEAFPCPSVRALTPFLGEPE